jgi:hypothetical protein
MEAKLNTLQTVLGSIYQKVQQRLLFFAATKQQHSIRYSAIYFNRNQDSIADKAAFYLADAVKYSVA